MSQAILTENCSIYVGFLENKAEEFAAGAYLLSVTEIENSVREIGMVLYLSLATIFQA